MNWTKSRQVEPKVDPVREFREIASDFGNPLEIVREAISNSFDAKANNINIRFCVETEFGERVLKIFLKDDGEGMDRDGLQSFFDLGNSLNRHDPAAIGEKGHGTKIYFNSERIEVVTHKNGKSYRAIMKYPKRKLFNEEVPVADIYEMDSPEGAIGTEITVTGYNGNRRDKFTYEQLRDYILWFTKQGSIEKEFGINDNAHKKVYLKGIDTDTEQAIEFGHVFAEENKHTTKLLDEYFVEAPDYYVRRWVEEKTLKNFPDIKYEAVFYIEGKKAKYIYNPMLRRQGYNAPQGAYTIQDRYGVYLCKDYIPIQRKIEWISTRGSEYTKFHAFVNCQALHLTANRGSVDNTPSEILEDLKESVLNLYNKILEHDDVTDLEYLEREAQGYITKNKEKKEFAKRVENAKKSHICLYNGVVLVEPRQEHGVYALFLQLSILEPELFPFEIIDYDSHRGIDLIVKTKDKVALEQATPRYVEFKHVLNKSFNHSFEYLHSIICWKTHIGHEAEIEDVQGTKRIFRIIPPEKPEDYTRCFLDDPRSAHKIEVFVLEQYLKEKIGLTFAPRTAKSSK